MVGRMNVATPMSTTAPDLLRLEDLSVSFAGREGRARAVRGVSLSVPAGRTVGIVGESGSGKSVTMMAVMGLLPANARREGSVYWDGVDVTNGSQLDRMRGRELAMVFQDPVSSLNPLMTIGRQVAEVLRVHQGMSTRAARSRSRDLLSLVGISSVDRVLDSYPHELSGGMCQRVMIAGALASEPKLLIADEPTTALDVTIQAQLLDLLIDLQRTLGIGIILISHDLAVVAQVCEYIAVMYAGRIVESGLADEILSDPRHPYTRALIALSPRLHGDRRRLIPIAGRPPDAHEDLEGCAFASRCVEAELTSCRREPPVVELTAGRQVRCWHALT